MHQDENIYQILVTVVITICYFYIQNRTMLGDDRYN